MTAAAIDKRPDARTPSVKPANRSKQSGRPPTRHFRSGWLLLLALFVAAVGGTWWRYRETPAEGPAELVLQGNIDVRQVNLAFKVGGRIDTLAVDEGDTVRAGQVVATLDRVYFEDDLR